MKKVLVTLGLVFASSVSAGETKEPKQDPSGTEAAQEDPEAFQDPGGMYGEYESTQEASGTSWQPASSPFETVGLKKGDWVFMFQGYANAVYNDDPDPRGDQAGLSTNMFSLRVLRPTFDGSLGFRVMMSLEPTMGKDGYPLLIQTGQSADGTNPLFDRQHPHDLFSELAVTFTTPLTDSSSIFLYFAPVGEPALGPPSFLQRFSAVSNPVAPITQSWLNSTRITYGVLTLGVVATDKVKIEFSTFRGLEPDENHWGIESPEFNSFSGRVTVNPTPEWSLQGSYADLKQPERIHPGVDMNLFTASGTYNRKSEDGNWQTTVGWAYRKRDEEDAHNGFLAESAFGFHTSHTVFGRFESAQKDGLFSSDDPRTAEVFDVGKLSFGYVYSFPIPGPVGIGVGASASVHFLPDELEPVYDSKRPSSFLVFARFVLK